MEFRQAIEILMKMLNKYPLKPEEKIALGKAIGVLDWAALGKNRMKKIMEKKLSLKK